MMGDIVPQTYATLAGENWIEEISTVPAEVNVVAVDSAGRLFVGADNDIHRSVDAGATWTKVLDNPTGYSDKPYLLFVDSRDYIFAMRTNGTGTNNQIYRSTDNGMSWTAVQTTTPFGWHMAESSNGSLYWNSYTTAGMDYIYASHDSGATWSVFYNLSNGIVDHFHWVEVNPANNTQVYVATGDGQYDATIQRFNGASWDMIVNDTTVASKYQTTSIFFDDTYVYFMNDASERSWRMALTGSSSSDFEIILDNRVVFTTSNNFYDSCKVGDVYLGGTSEGQLWASWDGSHWVKVFDDVTGLIRSITRQGFPLYFAKHYTATSDDKLYRLSLTKEDVMQLYYKEYRLRRGIETNQANYILEQRVFNGTEYLDLTHVALSNVQASIKGLSVENVQANSGFESRSLSSWLFSSSQQAGNKSITTSEKYEGSYSANVTKNIVDSLDMGFANYPRTTITMNKGDLVVVSIWAKANTTLTQSLGIRFYNDTSGSAITTLEYFDVTTSWQRFSKWYRYGGETPFDIREDFMAKKGSTYQLFVDASMQELKDSHIARGDVGSTESIQFWDYTPTTYNASTLHTRNPILTVNGETVSHSGELTNGTESSAMNLTGILTGAVKVEANIQGSGLAILRLTGTRILYEDSIILKGRKDNVYYGRYYDTYAPTTTITDLIALTNLQANITSLSYASNKLTLTIDSAFGMSSTTKVYVGNKEQPTTVRGATSWSYNETSRILTITANHTSTNTITITLNWNPLGDINGDGSVNTLDLTILGGAYGATPTNLNWDLESDLNSDNIIDVHDLYLLGKNYSKTTD